MVALSVVVSLVYAAQLAIVALLVSPEYFTLYVGQTCPIFAAICALLPVLMFVPSRWLVRVSYDDTTLSIRTVATVQTFPKCHISGLRPLAIGPLQIGLAFNYVALLSPSIDTAQINRMRGIVETPLGKGVRRGEALLFYREEDLRAVLDGAA